MDLSGNDLENCQRPQPNAYSAREALTYELALFESLEFAQELADKESGRLMSV
jgi:hypothetical protein